jgi:hypothetical protein
MPTASDPPPPTQWASCDCVRLPLRLDALPPAQRDAVRALVDELGTPAGTARYRFRPDEAGTLVITRWTSGWSR